MSRASNWTSLLGILILALAPLAATAQSECTVTVTPEEGEAAGAVTAVGTDSFDLDTDGDGTADVTIHVDDATEFEGVEDLSGLEVGDLVWVKGEEQEDGSILAEEVTLLFDEDDDDSVTGRIACVDVPPPILAPCPIEGCPEATAIHLVIGGSAIDHPFAPMTFQVNILSGTTFKVNKGNIDTSGFDFDAANLGVGQRVTAAGGTFTGGEVVEIDADKIILKLQAFDGTVEPGSIDTNQGTFQINIVSASSDLDITEPVTVKTSGMTRFAGRLRNVGALNTTDTYRIKGILMRDPNGSDASAVIFLAKIIKKLKGGIGAPPVPVN